MKVRTSRTSIGARGTCRTASHLAVPEFCPIHDCAECCVELFAEGPRDTTEPPYAPAYRLAKCAACERACGGCADWLDEMHGDLWETFVHDDGCEVCEEIVDRHRPMRDQNAHAQHFDEVHCVSCEGCRVGELICTECHLCPECARTTRSCIDWVSRWSGKLQRDVEVEYAAHTWRLVGLPAFVVDTASGQQVPL